MRIFLRLNMFMFVTDAERKKIRNHEEVHPGAKNDETGVPVRWLPRGGSSVSVERFSLGLIMTLGCSAGWTHAARGSDVRRLEAESRGP